MPAKRISILEIAIMAVVSVAMVVLSALKFWPLGMVEVLGFVTGGVCVWLTVRENVWNWPIGLANNIVFFVLFLEARIYADMSLQVIYFGLGVWGWLEWLYGGENRTALRISRARWVEWVVLAAFVPLATLALREWLVVVKDAAPFADALTTVLSLAAQYLLCLKRIENWWFWIAADIVYIPMYFHRSLPLTAVLYAILLIMCVVGMREWRATLRAQEAHA